jgi:hypothetical protein
VSSQVTRRAIESVHALNTYFQQKIMNVGAPHYEQMQQFRAARIFCPFRLLERVRDVEATAWAIVEPLLCIKGFTKDALDHMCEQYVALVPQLSAWCEGQELAAETVKRAEDAWAFWGLLKRQGETCSAWTRAAARVALLLPSSTDVERFFSTAGGTTKRTQMALSEDNQEIRHLLAYNAERPL